MASWRKLWFWSVLFIGCHGNELENDITKHGLYEDKLFMAVSDLKSRLVALESSVSYVRKKTRQSSNILRDLDKQSWCKNDKRKGRNNVYADVVLGGEEASGHCPEEFPVRRLTSCYRFVPEKITWAKAREHCIRELGYLVAIETEAENKFLLDYIDSNKGVQHCDFWTGGNDQLEEGSWVWNQTAQPLSYTHWHTWEPNNGNGREHCLWLDWYFRWEWNDATCDRQKACYICERGL